MLLSLITAVSAAPTATRLPIAAAATNAASEVTGSPHPHSPPMDETSDPPSMRTGHLQDQSSQPAPEIGGNGGLGWLDVGGQLCVPVGKGLMAIRVSFPGQ